MIYVAPNLNGTNSTDPNFDPNDHSSLPAHIRKHFPMGAADAVPGLVATMGFFFVFCVQCLTRSEESNNEDRPNWRHYHCAQDCMLIIILIVGVVAILLAVFRAMMFHSFVGVTGNTVHLVIPSSTSESLLLSLSKKTDSVTV